MNFCPNCGHNLRGERVLTQGEIDAMVAVDPLAPREMREEAAARLGPRVAERAPTVTELMKPVPNEPCREDFTTEAAWQAYLRESAALHRTNRIAAAMSAWDQDRPCDQYPRLATAMALDGVEGVDFDALLAWHESTAKQDGASNAKLLREWREWAASIKHPDIPQPTDKELVEWARARRAAAEGSAEK